MSGENGQFSLEHLRKMASGIELFNQEKYWECHEELEDHWLEDMGDNARYVYWVVIQVATALYHHRDGNLAGARGMINKAKDKIARCGQYGVESDIMFKFLSWKRFKSLVLEVPKDPSLEDFQKLAKFTFSDPNKWEQHLP